jgi:hypothetical protein
VLRTENPDGVVGTFRLSEPSWMPDPSLFLFVSVTVRLDGNDWVPPGPTIAGLVAVHPLWPFGDTAPVVEDPQITIE